MKVHYDPKEDILMLVLSDKKMMTLMTLKRVILLVWLRMANQL